MRASVALFVVATDFFTFFPAPAHADDAGVVLHVDSPRPVRLERSVPFGYELVCQAPCDVVVPPFAETTFRVSGPGVVPRVIPLSGAAGQRVVLTIDPATTAARTAARVTGGVMIGVGGFATLIALVTEAAAVAFHEYCRPCDLSGVHLVLAASAGTLGAGVGLVVGPGSSKTEIWWKKGPVALPARETAAIVVRRTPTWTELTGPRQKSAMNVPLLRLRF